MKGLILAGGKGTRLRPITYTRAKQLIPVANKPIIFYGIEAIAAAGVSEIGIVVGDTKDEVMAAVGDGGRWGIRISYIEQEAPLGLAHAVKVSRDFLAGDRFVMYLGDNIIKDGIAPLVEEFRTHKPNAQILLARVPNPSQFGVAEIDGSRIVRLEEKPKKPRSDLALVGVYMFDENVFRAVDAIKPSRRGELEITDAISWLVDNGCAVTHHIIRGWWKDTGKLDDLLEANRIMLDLVEEDIRGKVDADSKVHGKVVIADGAVVENSTVRGPAIIGARARIRNCYIGPFTAVGEGACVENAEVEHSILMDDAVIENIPTRIDGSLVGRGARIGRAGGQPRALRFMLGDQSEAWL